ncbi:MAG: hypothetical protein ABWY22_09455 [Flavobacterium sp.]
MKHLIFFLLFTTIVFSQNYHYAIDDAPVKTPEIPPGVNNQLEEIKYFEAFLLPIAQKANLQAALDLHGAVRLEKGDYSGVDIVMKSNQRLYGYPSLTKVSNITITAGSTGVVLENLLPQDKTITLQAGGVISNCTFKSIKWATLKATNATFTNNTFINYGGNILIDCSQSGYFRNNKFIKHQSGGLTTVLTMKGNTATPSYGNVNLHTNFLTPHGDTSELNNLVSATFVGIDAEGWNLTGDGTKAMFKASNMGNVKITDLGGGNSYSAVRTGAYDIDAANISILNKKLFTEFDVISPRTNMIMIAALGGYKRGSGTVTGYDLLGNLDNTNTLKYNNVEQTTAITNTAIVSNLSASILGNKYTPWSRPAWETLPDPTGANWRSDRVGKPDSTTYIQNLINTNGVAELPEGVYYISSTLKVPLDRAHGIMGKGTGKTSIVGLKDDFPLITLTGGQDDNFVLAHLTLQGGSVGVYSSQNFGTQHMSFVWLKYVVFRDQNYGFQLDKMMGFDNNFFDNISFVNCNKGFFQDPLVNGDSDHSSFVDKTMFYRSQFINCNTAVSMLATRADNLNAWVDCKFSGGQSALILGGNNYPIAANCDFTGFTGKQVISSGDISLYNSNFYSNSTTASTIKAINSYIEGCNFSDATTLFSSVIYNPVNAYITNSTVTSTVSSLVIDGDWNSKYSGVFMNSNFKSNSTLSKLLVNVKEGTATVIINTASNPYPQLLVTR